MHADKKEIFNKYLSKLIEGTSFNCHHGDRGFKIEIADWRMGNYVFLNHKLPFSLYMPETTEFNQNGEKCAVKTRFYEIGASGLFEK